MGIRLRLAASGKFIEGTVNGQYLVWNSTTRTWDFVVPPTPRLFDVDIRDFGAVSGANSTTAINAAIASLGATGGRVIVPRGNYIISADVVLNGNTALVGGQGSKLTKTGTDHHIVRLEGSFNLVEGLEIDGANLAQGSLIVVHGSDNRVLNNYLHNNGNMADGAYANASHGITLDGQVGNNCRRNFISKNRVVTVHDIGISQHTAPDNKIVDNDVSTCGLEGVTIDVTSHQALVALNRIIGNCVRGGVGAIGIDGSEIYRIVNNHIAGTLNNLSGIKTQNNTGNSSFGLIQGNTILDNTLWGIWLFAGTSGSPDQVNINGNIIRGNPSGSIRLDAGCDNNIVTDNCVNGVAPSNAGAGNSLANNI